MKRRGAVQSWGGVAAAASAAAALRSASIPIPVADAGNEVRTVSVGWRLAAAAAAVVAHPGRFRARSMPRLPRRRVGRGSH